MHLAVNVNVLIIVDGTLSMVLSVLLIACFVKVGSCSTGNRDAGNGCLRTG